MNRPAYKLALLGRDTTLWVLTIALVAAIGAVFPQSATLNSLRSVLDDTSILILLALAQMPVLLTRSIDLSVAANLALTGMCSALFNHAFPEAGVTAVVILAIPTGTLLGAFNGLL